MAIMNSHANPLSTLLILSISSRNLDSMVSCQSCRNVLSTWSRGRGRGFLTTLYTGSTMPDIVRV